MSMLLDDLRTLAADAANTNAMAYADLVASAADSDPSLDAATVLRLLPTLGRTPDEFAADMARALRRRELVAVVATRPDAEAKLAGIRGRIEGAESRLEAVRAEVAREIRTLRVEESAAVGELAAIKAAALELSNTADPAARGRVEAVTREMAAVARERDRLRDLLARREQEATHPGPERRAVKEKAEVEIPRVKAELAAVEAREAALNRDLSTARGELTLA